MEILFISSEDTFIIIFFAVLIFGPKKIPEIARSLGLGVKYIQKAIQEIKEEIYKE
ncbi:MAG TPA: twin-arginine translocase TatA/TatE family subunit [Candidatus Angelobacter sp.]|jgi:sec-independent protein translocase protein TatA|nr:twin-arginine translocase TatA/TatE family subunit [Candidatus Angelobacter sp.]